MAFGADAVVLSNKPCDAGVEVLAMAPEGIAQIEQVAETAPRQIVNAPAAAAPARQATAQPNTPVEQDVQRLAMSTLSFQDYVRERLLRRRRAAMQPDAPETVMPTFEERAPAVAPRASAPKAAQPIASPALAQQPAAAMPSRSAAMPMPPALAVPAPSLPSLQPSVATAMPITVPAARELRLPDPVPSLA